MNYNLLNEEWIPVLYRDGEWRRVGIRKALEDAPRIRQVAASNPMDRVAIVRFLLAVLSWCRGNPPNDAEVTSRGSFPSEWGCKLDLNRDCFNLLGDKRRFFQEQQDSARLADRETAAMGQENFPSFPSSTWERGESAIAVARDARLCRRTPYGTEVANKHKPAPSPATRT